MCKQAPRSSNLKTSLSFIKLINNASEQRDWIPDTALNEDAPWADHNSQNHRDQKSTSFVKFSYPLETEIPSAEKKKKSSSCNCVQTWVRINGKLHKHPGPHIFHLWNNSTLKLGKICKILHQPQHFLGLWCPFKDTKPMRKSASLWRTINQIFQQSCWIKAVYWGYSANGWWKRSSNETQRCNSKSNARTKSAVSVMASFSHVIGKKVQLPHSCNKESSK